MHPTSCSSVPFPTFANHGSFLRHHLGKIEGARRLHVAGAAFQFEIPVTNLPVQEPSIGRISRSIDIARGSRVLLAYSPPCRNLKMQNTAKTLTNPALPRSGA
jgi:hypothetical protein